MEALIRHALLVTRTCISCSKPRGVQTSATTAAACVVATHPCRTFPPTTSPAHQEEREGKAAQEVISLSGTAGEDITMAARQKQTQAGVSISGGCCMGCPSCPSSRSCLNGFSPFLTQDGAGHIAAGTLTCLCTGSASGTLQASLHEPPASMSRLLDAALEALSFDSFLGILCHPSLLLLFLLLSSPVPAQTAKMQTSSLICN
jgi:hypothetical protein